MTSATFADEETWFKLIGTAGRTLCHMHTAGAFTEAAGTELCKWNVDEIADVELDCVDTYPLAM